MPLVKSWSYSAWAQFDLCPAQYKYERIEKRPTGPKPHFDKGNRIHKNLENHVRHGAPLSAEIVKEREFIAELRASKADKKLEEKWGFTKDWSPIGWAPAHFRAVLDVLVIYDQYEAEVVDWKSGKKYGHNQDQMELFAVTVMQRFPFERVSTRLVYVEVGGQEFGDFDRAQLTELTAKWESRAGDLFAETAWLPRPNEKCHFCDFSKSKGGPCRYG